MYLKIAALIVFACLCIGVTIIGVLVFTAKDDSPATVGSSAPTTAVSSSPQTVVVTRECTDAERQREQAGHMA